MKQEWIYFINQNEMSVVSFYSGPAKFILWWLDRMDITIRKRLTLEGIVMKRGLATSRLYMSPEGMGVWLKSCVAVYLLELGRTLLKFNLEPFFELNISRGWRS